MIFPDISGPIWFELLEQYLPKFNLEHRWYTFCFPIPNTLFPGFPACWCDWIYLEKLPKTDPGQLRATSFYFAESGMKLTFFKGHGFASASPSFQKKTDINEHESAQTEILSSHLYVYY